MGAGWEGISDQLSGGTASPGPHCEASASLCSRSHIQRAGHRCFRRPRQLPAGEAGDGPTPRDPASVPAGPPRVPPVTAPPALPRTTAVYLRFLPSGVSLPLLDRGTRGSKSSLSNVKVRTWNTAALSTYSRSEPASEQCTGVSAPRTPGRPSPKRPELICTSRQHLWPRSLPGTLVAGAGPRSLTAPLVTPAAACVDFLRAASCEFTAGDVFRQLPLVFPSSYRAKATLY